MFKFSQIHTIKESHFYWFILCMTGLRILTNHPKPCPEFFDCNAYIQMLESIQYDPALLPHHSMRILAPLIARVLHGVGFDVETAFRILSQGTYVIFGLLSFWVMRRFVNPLYALSFTLLCLAPHSAMRISLQNVYQSCDMLVYPVSLMMIYLSEKRKETGVFLLACMGVLIRQNLFVLGVLLLIPALMRERHIKTLLYLICLCVCYFALQTYYHAGDSVAKHVNIPAHFFEVTHLWSVWQDSHIMEIVIIMLPLLALYYQKLFPFLIKRWYLVVYMAIVAGQPFVAFHLTGNNFARLALQGLWLIYLFIPMSVSGKHVKAPQIILLLYAVVVYFSWSMSTRYGAVVAFSFVCSCFYGQAAVLYLQKNWRLNIPSW